MSADDLEYGTSSARFSNFHKKERAATTKTHLANEHMNAFQKNDAARRAKLSDTTALDARVKRQEDHNADWHRHDVSCAAGGTTRTPELVNLRAAERAFTAAQKQSPVVIPPISTIIAVVEKWQREQAHYFESVFNYNSLVNYIVTGISQGWLTLSVEAVADGYARLLANNMIETAPDEYFDPNLNAIVRSRGFVGGRSAPTMFPKYVWPAEEAAAREEEIAQVLADHQAGRKEAEARPFAELQAEVRKGYHVPKPYGPNLDRSE